MNDVQLRPVVPLDDDFLGALYAASRAEEVTAGGWSAEFTEVFLAGQRTAQEAHYRAAYPSSQHHIIVVGNRAIGRLWVDRDAHRILLVDISLISDARGRGIGSRLIGDLIAEADARDITVELSVATNNVRAAILYGRLGFERVASSATHHRLQRLHHPPPQPER